MNRAFFICIVSALGIISCNRTPNVLMPNSSEISGDLSYAFDVPDQKIPIQQKEDKYDDDIYVKLHRTYGNIPKEFYEIGRSVRAYNEMGSSNTSAYVGFGIELFDDTGYCVFKISPNVCSSINSGNTFREAIKLDADDSCNICFSIKHENLIKAKTFRITSAYQIIEKDMSNIFDDVENSIDMQSLNNEDDMPSLMGSDIDLPLSIKDYISIVNRPLVLNNVDDVSRPEMSVTLKLLEPLSDFSQISNGDGHVFIQIVPLDKYGCTIDEIVFWGCWRAQESSDEVKSFLKGQNGDTMTVHFVGTNKSMDDKIDNVNGCRKIKKFKITFDLN